MLGCVSIMLQSGCRPRIITSSSFPGFGKLLSMKMFLRIAPFFRTVKTGIFLSLRSGLLSSSSLSAIFSLEEDTVQFSSIFLRNERKWVSNFVVAPWERGQIGCCLVCSYFEYLKK